MKTLAALVGMQHRGSAAFVGALPAGEPLTLKREPDNRFDSNAVQVWARGRHVGYVKAAQAKPIAMALDALIVEDPTITEFPAKLSVKEGGWPLVEMGEDE